jgi:hypothetical protein
MASAASSFQVRSHTGIVVLESAKLKRRGERVRAGGIAPPGQPRQPFPSAMEAPADVRLDGDEMAADADDGDAGHFSAAYMAASRSAGRSCSESARQLTSGKRASA